MTDDLHTFGGNSAAMLKSYVDRIERIQDDKDALAADIRELKAEARVNGFDVPALTAVLALRRKRQKYTEAEWAEREALIDLYVGALGDDPAVAAAEADATIAKRKAGAS